MSSEFQCPECGEPIDTSELWVGEEVECPTCGGMVTVPGESPEAEGRSNAGQQDRLGRGGVVLASIMLAITAVAWIGMTAFHFWTAYLFYTHWGLFAGFIAFATPPLAEIVALFACFWWGLWFYALAIAAILAAFGGAATCTAVTESGYGKPAKAGVGFFVVMALLLAGFAYFAIQAGSATKPVTAEEERELQDVAAAVCAVLNGCSSTDASVLAGIVEAKEKLRRRIRDYDEARRNEVRRVVDAYLRAQLLIERDAKTWLAGPNWPQKKLVWSTETRTAYNSLPGRLRMSDAEFQAIEKDLAELGGQRDSSNAPALFNALLQRRRTAQREVYKDLLGSTMPSPEMLTQQTP